MCKVKAETAYFNAYLRDPTRPELPVQKPPEKKKPSAAAAGHGSVSAATSKKRSYIDDGDLTMGGEMPRKRISVKDRLGIMPVVSFYQSYI